MGSSYLFVGCVRNEERKEGRGRGQVDGVIAFRYTAGDVGAFGFITFEILKFTINSIERIYT